MSKQINKLSDLEIDEISLVDRGANQHAELLISKRDEDEEELEKANPDPSDVSMSDGGYDDEDKPKKKRKKGNDGFFKNLVNKLFDESTTSTDYDGNIGRMDDVEKVGQMPGQQMPYGQAPMGMPAPGPQNAMPPGAQSFPAQGGQMPSEMMMQEQMPGQMQAGPPLPDEVVQYIQQLEEQLAMQNQQQGTPQPSSQEDEVNPFGKSVGYDDDYEFLQELSKNLENEEQRETVEKALEAVEKANERAAEAERIAKAERDFRVNQEYVAKARQFSGLPVSAEEFGPVLKKLSESLEDEEFEMLTKALVSANAAVTNGAFNEIGKRGFDSESVSKAEAKAAEIAKNEGISKESALARVYETDDEMYQEYLSEQGR